MVSLTGGRIALLACREGQLLPTRSGDSRATHVLFDFTLSQDPGELRTGGGDRRPDLLRSRDLRGRSGTAVSACWLEPGHGSYLWPAGIL